MKAIGIMSGTSLDGIDLCLVEINNEEKYLLEAFSTYPYSDITKNNIIDCSKLDTSNVQKITSLNFEIGYAYKDAIEKFIIDFNIDMDEVEFISMHGQTIWHNPNQMNGYLSSTFQIGEPSIIAYHFNKMVISNFRVMDMAAGGCGAPLIPFVNYVLYQSDKKSIALQNIGGIGNVCYLKKGGNINDIIAFDTGPGNMLIDSAMMKLFNKSFDENGDTALKGKIIFNVLNELLNDDYLRLPYPKSTGREKYNQDMLNNIIDECRKYSNSDYDIIATITAYTAYTIADSYKRFLKEIDEIIVSGGGSHNKFIIKLLEELMDKKIIVEDRTDAYEAFGFAILGYMTLTNRPSNVPSVTGAKKPVILGNITNPPLKENPHMRNKI